MNELYVLGGPVCGLLAVLFTIAHTRKRPPTDIELREEEAAKPVANPLIRSRYERLIAAFESGNRADILRRQSQLAQAGLDPPDSIEGCKKAIRSMKR